MDIGEALEQLACCVFECGDTSDDEALACLRVEVERLHTWAGIMSVLDEHYPSDVFTDGSANPDPGVRLITLMREVDRLQAIEARAREIAFHEVERLHTWAGIMSVLDEHYPSDVFTDGSANPDPGVRLITLMREVDRLQAIEARAREIAFHDGPMFTLVHPPELHWIGQWVLKGDPD